MTDRAPTGAHPAPGVDDDSTASPRDLAERWRSVPVAWRSVLFVFAALVALVAIVRVVGSVTNGNVPTGPAGSSYSTAPTGLAAMAQLLGDEGHAVTQSTQALSSTSLAVPGTLVISAPEGWASANNDDVARFARRGGNIVLAGQPPPGLLEAVLADRAPTWQVTHLASATAVPGAIGIPGVTSVDLGSDEKGAWTVAPGVTPILSGTDGTFACTARLGGGGAIVMLADLGPLSNSLLDHADNAALALDVAGPPATPVTFDEYDHGYGQHTTGFAALPANWKTGLLVLLLAVVVWLVAAARRFGPHELKNRPLLPARVAHVDAVGRRLATSDPAQIDAALAPVRERARALVCERLGLPVDADDAAIVRTAGSLPLPDGVDLRVLLDGPRDAEGVLATGRALSVLESERTHR